MFVVLISFRVFLSSAAAESMTIFYHMLMNKPRDTVPDRFVYQTKTDPITDKHSLELLDSNSVVTSTVTCGPDGPKLFKIV